jgi:shikimate kinase
LNEMTKSLIFDDSSALPRHPIVALAGFMGSGKTSTGQALAELLGWEFIDLDGEIEAQEGSAIRSLFQERGEAAFREAEHKALRHCMVNRRPTVLALGGGAFVQANNVELLRDGRVFTVFLETPVNDMLQRCGVEDSPGQANARPLAADATAFRSLYEQRLPHYRGAQVTIDTSGKSVAEVAREIAECLELQRFTATRTRPAG